MVSTLNTTAGQWTTAWHIHQIEDEGGQIVEPTSTEHQAFVDAVKPQHDEARSTFGDKIFTLTGL